LTGFGAQVPQLFKFQPDGNFYIISNRGEEYNFTHLKILKNGKLGVKRSNKYTRAKDPRNFVIDPTGKFCW
jgi:6-phosphogluconolactonase (cycloisomerase 2 family)